MVSRDTIAQFGAVAVAMALAALSAQFGDLNAAPSLLLAAATYLVLFAGSHVYLALRGDGEAVPVAARWRFVGLVLGAVAAFVAAVRYGGVEVAGVRLETLLAAVVGVSVLGYWGYEIRDGYRTARS
ncbi:hypothetical protein KTS45_03260 [Halomicroarcula limicola]|uniref:Uncharacterized protein n=1 Tax=Haloarcula limicola TaxID=1429915 RepID=A0A8J7Y7N7_9EURY|nr:hypothetical protein [Halomicroarcula limicola]MBV0923208.1 hypothetical protein [Halomicroarcula limicola]